MTTAPWNPDMAAALQESLLMHDVYCVASGKVSLSWPKGLTAVEIDEAEHWLALVVRKMRRLAEPLLPLPQPEGER